MESYETRVWNAYCEWCKAGKDNKLLDTIADKHDVDPWHIEREHRIALDLV